MPFMMGMPSGSEALRSTQEPETYSTTHGMESYCFVRSPPTAQPCEGESITTALRVRVIVVEYSDHWPPEACQMLARELPKVPTEPTAQPSPEPVMYTPRSVASGL